MTFYKPYLLVMLLFISNCMLAQQNNDICYIMLVSGDVSSGNNYLEKGDTVSLNRLSSLSFSNKAYLTLYNKQFGTFKFTQTLTNKLKKESFNYSDFFSEIIGINNDKIPLSSRGDCECFNFSCFYSNSLINNKILLIDEIIFKSERRILTDYFVQFTDRGITYNRFLKNINEAYVISKDLFKLNDSSLFSFDTTAYLCARYQVNGNNQFEIICDLDFSIVRVADIESLYKTYNQILSGMDKKQVYEEFINAVYKTYGKPNLCQVNKIIGYED